MQTGNAFSRHALLPEDRPAPPQAMPMVTGGGAPGNAFARIQQIPAQQAPMQAPAPSQNPSGNAFRRGLSAFASGIIGPERTAQIDQQRAAKAEQIAAAKQTRAKSLLATYQNLAALPMEQRAATMQQLAPEIAQASGKPVEQILADNDFSDQAMQRAVATFRSLAGEGPEKTQYQFLNQANGGVSRANASTGQVEQVIKPVAEPVKPVQKDYVAQEFGGKVWMVNKNDPNDKYEMGRPNPSASASNQDSYRPATPAELKAYGIPDGTAVKINTRTGEPHVVSGAKPASEYTVKQQNDFLASARTTDALEGAVNQYEQLIDQYGPQFWDRNLNPADNPGQRTEAAAKLDAARTNVDIQIKELFNLGVLNGPDVDIIRGAIPDLTGAEAFGSGKKPAKASLGVVHDYIARARNQIPAEYVAKARPNGTTLSAANAPRVAQSATGWSANPLFAPQGGQQSQPTQNDDIHPDIVKAIDGAFGPDEEDVPEGLTPEEWNAMDEADKALWQH